MAHSDTAPTLPPLPTATPVRAVFFGDSISAPRSGYGQYIFAVCEAFGWVPTNATGAFAASATDHCAALGGTMLQDNDHTLGNALETWEGRVAAFRPAVVVMLYGTNDFWYTDPALPTPMTPETWHDATRRMIAHPRGIASRPHVVVCGIPLIAASLGVPPWASRLHDQARIMNGITAACRRAGVIYVDLWEEMTPGMLAPDGVHPSPAVGQPFIADAIVAALRERGTPFIPSVGARG